jgi:meso-butanediol dehydrogenase / (S,S)-butanediol dehydrogenase / diacetyl reductase
VRLFDKVALITGGGTGIGAATARRFAAEGARVIVLGRTAAPLEAVAAETGGLAVPGDAANADDVGRAVKEAVDRFGGLDVLVACAGDMRAGDVLEVDDETWAEDMRLNFTTCVVSARAVLPAMIERGGGSIISISSVGGLVGTPKRLTYSVAKTALLGLVRSLAVDYGPSGVRVNAVLPGLIKTQMPQGVMEDIAKRRGISVDDAYTWSSSMAPLRRAAEPSEIASVCLFLASPDSSFVTGTFIVADGGLTIVNPAAGIFDDAE